MSATARRPATYDDLCALPDTVVGEIVNGAVHASPRPASRHARAATKLSGKLDGAFDHDDHRPDGWLLLHEPELHLGPDVLVPDLAGWRRERMPEMPLTPAFTLAPDWVCEILSPGTAAIDRAEKLPIYAREGVAHAWLIDPLEQTLEVFRLARRAAERAASLWELVGVWRGDDQVRAEPFATYELALAALWSR